MENKFCFLKGIVECHSGVIQNCNNQRITKCPLDDQKKGSDNAGSAKKDKKKEKSGNAKQNFCFLKGELVECSNGRVQDCNNQRIRKCPLEEKPQNQDMWSLIDKLRQQKESPDYKQTLAIVRELMKKEEISKAVSEIMGPEIKAAAQREREEGIKNAVGAMRDLGHNENEIKTQIMEKFGISDREAKKYL